MFLEPEVTDRYELEWRPPDREGIIKFLCDEHQFSLQRVENAIGRAEKAFRSLFQQSTLEAWFG